MDEAIVKRRLIARAAEVSGQHYDREYQTSLIQKMQNPEFNTNEPWKQYIDQEIQQTWQFLDEKARLALYINAIKHIDDGELT